MRKMIKHIGFSILFSGMLLFAVSCEREWDPWGSEEPSDEVLAIIGSFHLPPSFIAGKTLVFSVTYYKPGICYERSDICTRLRGMEMDVEVWVKKEPSDDCPEALVEESAEFSVIFPYPGKYLLKFLGLEGPETISIDVQ